MVPTIALVNTWMVMRTSVEKKVLFQHCNSKQRKDDRLNDSSEYIEGKLCYMFCKSGLVYFVITYY